MRDLTGRRVRLLLKVNFVLISISLYFTSIYIYIHTSTSLHHKSSPPFSTSKHILSTHQTHPHLSTQRPRSPLPSPRFHARPRSLLQYAPNLARPRKILLPPRRLPPRRPSTRASLQRPLHSQRTPSPLLPRTQIYISKYPASSQKQYRYSIVFVLRAHSPVIVNTDELTTPITGVFERPMRGIRAG